MFAKKETINFENVDTFIGVHTNVKGDIKSEGSVRIDGKVTGDVKAAGEMIVGEKAEIKGNIICGDITVSGSLTGNVDSTGILKIHCTAKIFGDVKVKSLVADEGSILQGKCTMTEQNESAKGEPVPQKA